MDGAAMEQVEHEGEASPQEAQAMHGNAWASLSVATPWGCPPLNKMHGSPPHIRKRKGIGRSSSENARLESSHSTRHVEGPPTEGGASKREPKRHAPIFSWSRGYFMMMGRLEGLGGYKYPSPPLISHMIVERRLCLLASPLGARPFTLAFSDGGQSTMRFL